jgi:ActR/RegA family two-component response regulator
MHARLDARSILIADDDRLFVARLGERLPAARNKTHYAATPEQALTIVRANPIAAVIMEPNQRGMAWVRFIRSMRRRFRPRS